MEYPFKDFVLNGRSIRFEAVVQGEEDAITGFEKALFLFIRQWLQGDQSFELFTSGSTGDPKAITVTRSQMIASARLTALALDLKQNQTALLCLDPSFIAGKMMIVRTFVVGMSLQVVVPTSNPLQYANGSIDFAAMVPLQVHEIIRSNPTGLDNVKTLIIGGGIIDNETLKLLQNTSCQCYATYGMTETISHVALRKLNGEDMSLHFTAMPGIQFGEDDRGCLVVYWDQLSKTIVTNDMVRLIDKKRFEWLGRWDNVINTGGIKINPEKLEDAVAVMFGELGLNNRFIISHLTDARLGDKVVLIIEGDISSVLLSDITRLMEHTLSKYELPREILSCPMFVETLTGKVNRRETSRIAIGDRYSSR